MGTCGRGLSGDEIVNSRVYGPQFPGPLLVSYQGHFKCLFVPNFTQL